MLQKEKEEVSNIQSKLDISNWKSYQNTWYGFLLKYPSGWKDPMIEKPQMGEIWEQKVAFRLEQNDAANPFEGFDVNIYNVGRVRQVANAEEFPKLKNEERKVEDGCASIDGHLMDTGDYPAEEIYVPDNDPCFNAALFFTNTRGNYIYTIVPKIRDGWGIAGDPAQEASSYLPEFFGVVASWEITDIQRPKPVAVTPRVTSPLPLIYEKDSLGRRVCNKKNDHPAKSDKHKGKHMDMECCLDPDEYPNPNCFYSESKYGKYLK
jgi:hypothetical protein